MALAPPPKGGLLAAASRLFRTDAPMSALVFTEVRAGALDGRFYFFKFGDHGEEKVRTRVRCKEYGVQIGGVSPPLPLEGGFGPLPPHLPRWSGPSIRN